MAFEQKELSGSLFKNNAKANPKQPDYQGDCLIDGTKYRMSAWIKNGQKGQYMSIAFTLAEERFSKGVRQDPPQDTDVPF